MAKTYGTLQGTRGPATRCGGNNGVKVSAQSYDGSVIVTNWYDENNVLRVRVGTNNDSATYTGYESHDFVGTFEDFKKALELLDDIKNGRATVVHHRKAK